MMYNNPRRSREWQRMSLIILAAILAFIIATIFVDAVHAQAYGDRHYWEEYERTMPRGQVLIDWRRIPDRWEIKVDTIKNCTTYIPLLPLFLTAEEHERLMELLHPTDVVVHRSINGICGCSSRPTKPKEGE